MGNRGSSQSHSHSLTAKIKSIDWLDDEAVDTLRNDIAALQLQLQLQTTRPTDPMRSEQLEAEALLRKCRIRRSEAVIQYWKSLPRRNDLLSALLTTAVGEPVVGLIVAYAAPHWYSYLERNSYRSGLDIGRFKSGAAFFRPNRSNRPNQTSNHTSKPTLPPPPPPPLECFVTRLQTYRSTQYLTVYHCEFAFASDFPSDSFTPPHVPNPVSAIAATGTGTGSGSSAGMGRPFGVLSVLSYLALQRAMKDTESDSDSDPESGDETTHKTTDQTTDTSHAAPNRTNRSGRETVALINRWTSKVLELQPNPTLTTPVLVPVSVVDSHVCAAIHSADKHGSGKYHAWQPYTTPSALIAAAAGGGTTSCSGSGSGGSGGAECPPQPPPSPPPPPPPRRSREFQLFIRPPPLATDSGVGIPNGWGINISFPSLPLARENESESGVNQSSSLDSGLEAEELSVERNPPIGDT